MNFTDRILRTFAMFTPGSPAHVAAQKRDMELKLREAGLSRSHARAIVAQKFASRG